MEAGIFFLFIIIVIGSILFSIQQSKQLDQTWSAVARSLGLMYDSGSMMKDRVMSGNIDGCAVTVQTLTRGSGKDSKKYTRYQVSYPSPMRVSFRISRQGFVNSLTKAFGAQDIKMGDREFDQLVMIKGDDAHAVAQFLTLERREKITRLFHEFNDVEMDELSLTSVYYGRESSGSVMIEKIQRLVEFAGSMAVEQVNPVMPSSPPPLRFKPTLAHPGTILTQAGTVVGPPPLPGSASPSLPATPVQPTTNEPPAEGSETSAMPSTASTASESASMIGQTLFGQRWGITEIDQTFAKKYRGIHVTGEGTLRSWAENSYDFVFGTGKFVKATIEMPLEKSATNLHGSFQVILKLPLSSRTTDHGREFSFAGKLVKADALMRQLYVDAYEESV